MHGDGTLPSIVVRRLPWPRGREGRYDPRPPYGIVVNEYARHPALTLLHEVGHVLDHLGLGGSIRLASASDPALDHWRAAVRSSLAFVDLEQSARLSTNPDLRATIAYLTRPEELWARSYTQYVALRSGNPDLAAQLAARRQPQVQGRYIPRQWTDADFAPIAAAFDDLFWRLGWIT